MALFGFAAIASWASEICCSNCGSLLLVLPPPSPMASKMPPMPPPLPTPKPTNEMKKMNASMPKTTCTTFRRLPLLRSKIIGAGA